MEKLWKRICSHYEISEDVSITWFERIKKQLSTTSYRNAPRCYHNWQEMMPNKCELLEHCKPIIILAALFQYYHFEGNTNHVHENCSAMDEFCNDAMLEDEETRAILHQLLGEKLSPGQANYCCDDDINLLQDIDLAILGFPSEQYKRYTELLRKEYQQMDDITYKQMRLKVLEALLRIPSIFATPEFRNKYELNARANILAEIQDLKNRKQFHTYK